MVQEARVAVGNSQLLGRGILDSGLHKQTSAKMESLELCRCWSDALLPQSSTSSSLLPSSEAVRRRLLCREVDSGVGGLVICSD